MKPAGDARHALLPKPRLCQALGGQLRIPRSASVKVSAAGSYRALHAAHRFAELVEQEFGVGLPVIEEDRGFCEIAVTVDGTAADHPPLAPEHDLGSEGYTLEVSDRSARVQSPTAEGLFWGAMTLRQLIRRANSGLVVPGVRIVDTPRYRWRGFMVDSGRSPNSLPKIKRIIRICSTLKLNFMVFREGDDELCAVRYNTNTLGSTNPHAFSMDEARDLVDYADRYGIKVVPEIESLGHSTAKGFHYPELVSGGFEHSYEDMGSHTRKSHLAPADPRSYELLESIYQEWFPVIRSPLVHLGLDEVRLETETQSRHLAGLLEVVDRVSRKHGKRIAPIVWGDAPPTPPDWRGRVIRCLWAYGDTVEPIDLANPHLLKQGIAELASEGCREQVFMAAGSGSGHTPHSKTDYEHAFGNLARWAMLGSDRPNFTGLLAVQWSGNMLDEWLPDFAAAADMAWNPPVEAPGFEPEMQRVRGQLSRLKDARSPAHDEIDPPAWDGIWLRDGRWHEDLVAAVRAAAHNA